MKSQKPISYAYFLVLFQTTSTSVVKASWNGEKFQATVRQLQQQQEIQATESSGHKICIIDGDTDCKSSYYIFKEFENGVTFAQAHTATGNDPELEGCVLAPVYSYEDLVNISDTIPPCKSAYTAASKDPLTTFRQSQSCLNQGKVPYNCDFEALGTTLESLWGDETNKMGNFGACSLSGWFEDASFLADIPIWCPALRDDWVNFGSSEPLPPEVWKAGDSSYCGDGPIHNAAAAFATDYSRSEPTAVLKAVNGAEHLDGAVYQCCRQSRTTC